MDNIAGGMVLTNSDMLQEAINSFKEEMVVMMNERAAYAGEYIHLCSESTDVGLVHRQQRMIKLKELLKASNSSLENLEMYIKAASVLVKWMHGNFKGAHLPQLQVLVPHVVQTILSGVGQNGSEMNRHEAVYASVRIWADLYDVAQTLMIQA
ncbi:hypothetical protein [Ralstonia phage RSF1]|uniref:Uncharacterized protein n=1 Tax=Ralstonia phage RSF1 TaxID=1689679 RepID=A0A0K2QQS2_9CAUD|nr:hypothetical protein AVU11_gp106 [Ralstonia phage RSF1]BAS04898.1 hypothetical protein [Ralstonia phage RSF1]